MQSGRNKDSSYLSKRVKREAALTVEFSISHHLAGNVGLISDSNLTFKSRLQKVTELASYYLDYYYLDFVTVGSAPYPLLKGSFSVLLLRL